MRVMKAFTSTQLPNLVSIAVMVCLIKFLMTGVTFDLQGHAISLGTADSMTYAAILGPLLAGHSYVQVKGGTSPKADNFSEEDTK